LLMLHKNKEDFTRVLNQVAMQTGFLLPLVERYSEIVNPLLEERSYLRNQNQKLAQARDLLLPRLMSGAIDPIRYDKLYNGVEV
jgi:hypothetical protein